MLIFWKTWLVLVTLQDFYLVFSKNFVVFEKRPFKIFQKTFLLKTSFALARILFFFKLWCLIFWNFFSVGSLSNLFWEFNLFFLLKRNSMKIWDFHILETTHDLAFLPMWWNPSKTSPPPCNQPKFSVPTNPSKFWILF